MIHNGEPKLENWKEYKFHSSTPVLTGKLDSSPIEITITNLSDKEELGT